MGKTIIVGGGISGLSTAFGLLRESRRLGKEPDLLVLESSPRPGGKIWSERVDGYLCEWGPDGFLDNAPTTLELSRELGLEDRLVRAGAQASKRRFLLLGGKLQALPASPPAFLTSPLLPLRGRLRVLLEPFIRRAPAGVEESVAAFASRRLGKAFASVLVDAMVTGIYGGNAEELSVAAAFPRLKRLEAEHGSLVRGALALARERRRARKAQPAAGREDATIQTGPSGTLTSLRGGLSELTEALGREIGGDRLRTGAPAGRLLQRDGGLAVEIQGEVLSAERVVLAMPAQAAGEMVGGLSPRLGEMLRALPIAPIAVVCMGFRREQVRHPLDGFGFLVPHSEGLPLLGCIFSTSVYPDRGPEGRVLLRALLGGRRAPEVVEDTPEGLIRRALAILGPLLGIEGEPEMARAVRHRHAIPQYTLGHLERIAAAEREAATWPGLTLTGNAYHGVSMNDCIKNGLELGRKLAER
jgi:protoporphyrinogen/coproporphyrinogen III oxidase